MVMEVIYKNDLPTEDDLFSLYEALGWSGYANLSPNQLLTAMKQSYYAVYAYVDNKLVGTGRAVSDGVIYAYLCGLGVLPDYRNNGIGTEIARKLTAYCKESNLRIQFFCKDNMVSYYERIGFERFAIGMRL